LDSLFLALGLGLSAFAQPGIQPPPAPGTIDQVPDYVAFRLFFAAVAGNSSPTPAETAKQDSNLKPIQLTDVDRGVLVRALSGFKSNLSNAQHAPQTTSLDAIAQSTLTDLLAQMSPYGFQRLYTYVRFQKMYMREVPFPASMTAHH